MVEEVDLAKNPECPACLHDGCSNRTILSKTTFVGGLGHCDLKLGVRGGASASGRRCGAAPALDPTSSTGRGAAGAA